MSNNIDINNNEQFDPANYPNAMRELAVLRSGISNIAIYFKVEIVVSFLKYHALPVACVYANPALAQMVTSGIFKTSHLESLFESSRRNKTFLNNFEEYISKQLLMRKN